MNCPQEDELMESLRALAAASADEQAPPRVEERLRQAFRQRSVAARPAVAPKQIRRWPWIGVAAAGSVAAGVLLFRPAATPPPDRPAIVAPAAVAQTAAPVAAPAPQIIAQTARKRRKRKPAPSPVVEVGTDFLPVAQGDEWTPLDGARLMRVELPKSALGVFGFPMNEERVKADVMLSDDGLLRAIRFVQ